MRATILLLLLLAATASAQGTIRYLKLHAAALEGNLLGDPADQEVAVYLPRTSAARWTR